MNEFNIMTDDKSLIKAHAINTYDLRLSMNMSVATMREKIVEYCIKNNLEVPVLEVHSKQDKADLRNKKKVKLITINVQKSDKPGGREPAVVGVQCVLYTIPRGININVSPSIVEALKNAITDNVTQDPDDGEILHDEVPTYAFSVLGEVQAA
ncbi:MAG: hypothetical protein DRI65_12885 [Chloroflexota bacterium]|nr:MAG: hypothetical protein DRI65_12885 [Chloroflexota bacterium]